MTTKHCCWQRASRYSTASGSELVNSQTRSYNTNTAMSRIFYNSQSQPIQIGQKVGTGGEGTVYEIFGQSDFVAKVYHEPPDAEKVEKLIALSRLRNERLLKIAAWPVEVLHLEARGVLAGFVMKRIGQASEVHTLHSPKSRLQKFPEASWAFLIYVAANIARAVATMHEHDFIVGDLNPKNILVTHQATVTLLDCDSFQVTAEGKTFRCEGGFPEYLPPELQGLSLRDVERKSEHDCFGLAVVIFQLLFMGRHPFSGKYLIEGELTLEDAIRNSRFAFGADASARLMQQPPGTLPLESIPAPLNNLFRRAFLSADRPKPQEWIEPLESLAKSLKACNLHTGHFFFNELTECPWCEIEMRARIRLFNFSLNGHNGQRGHFKLDEIWSKIETLQAPQTALALANMRNPLALPPVPSPEVASFSRGNRNKLLQAVLFVSVAGFAVGYFASWPVALFLAFLVGALGKRIARAEFQNKSPQVINFSQQTLPAPDNSIAAEVRARLERAEQYVQQLETSFQRMPTAGNFGSKLAELKNRKEVYERLPKIREFKLKQMEASANDRQLNAFLDQFEISEAGVKDIDFLTVTSLRSHGIETAADVTPERLKQVPHLAESQAQQLLFWRAGAKRQFNFDNARDVQVKDRLNVEREMDNLRMQLEHDLTTGAVYLQRLQHETESQRQQITKALPEAYQLHAQAERDWETVQKRNPMFPLMILLAIFFVYGCFVSLASDPSPAPGVSSTNLEASLPAGRVTFETPAPAEIELSLDETEARRLLEKGEKQMKLGKWVAAAKLFTKATELDPQLQPAYVQLGVSLYQQRKYDESIVTLTQATRIRDEFEPNFYLGLAYKARKEWKYAGDSFVQAIGLDRYQENPKFADAYYYLGEALTRTGQAESSIQKLERGLKYNTLTTAHRLQLATLYLWTDKYDLAEKQRKVLVSTDANLAKQLQRLMKLHKKRT